MKWTHSLTLQFLDKLSEQLRLGHLQQMINAALGDAEAFHGGGGAFPQPLLLFALREIEFADQVGEALALQRALVLVIALDDLLLVRGVILVRHGILLAAIVIDRAWSILFGIRGA